MIGKKNLLIICVAVIIAITAFAVFGDNGLLDVYRLEKERDRLANKIDSVTMENKQISREITLLKTDKRYVVKVARKELGMIGKNEVIYKLEKQEPEKATIKE